MKTEVKKIDANKREISIEVSGEVVKNKFEDVFKRLGQEAKVPGFRPGHIPRDILEKNFSADAHRRVLEELIPDIYSEAIKAENLEVIELPEITDVKLRRENETLAFKATVEVRPEIKLKNYKGIKVEYKKIAVTTEEIKRSLDSLKEARKLESIDDRIARGLGYLNLTELENALEKQIYIQKENQQRQKIEHEIIQTVTKDLDFQVPQSLVNRQLEDLVRQAKLDLALKGAQRQEIDAQEKDLAAKLEPEAKKEVKVYLVLAEIAKKENISLDDHMPSRVMELLLKEAEWQESS